MKSSTKNAKRCLVNLGCGPAVMETSWQDYDGSWNVLASRLPFGLGRLTRRLLQHHGEGYPAHVRYLDVNRRLPFGDQTVDAVYFSHLLEHLHLDEGCRLLAECRRILKPDGIIRVVVPDTEYFLAGYSANILAGKSDACLILNQKLWYRPLVGKGGFLRGLYTAITDFHSHKFMYDRRFLADRLAAVGFVSIKEAQYGVSLIPEIAEVELKDRIGNGAGFGFEAIRPQGI